MTQIPDFYCPKGCEKVIDEKASNENWQVQSSKCPKCGTRLKFRMIEKPKKKPKAEL